MLSTAYCPRNMILHTLLSNILYVQNHIAHTCRIKQAIPYCTCWFPVKCTRNEYHVEHTYMLLFNILRAVTWDTFRTYIHVQLIERATTAVVGMFPYKLPSNILVVVKTAQCAPSYATIRQNAGDHPAGLVLHGTQALLTDWLTDDNLLCCYYNDVTVQGLGLLVCLLSVALAHTNCAFRRTEPTHLQLVRTALQLDQRLAQVASRARPMTAMRDDIAAIITRSAVGGGEATARRGVLVGGWGETKMLLPSAKYDTKHRVLQQ